ncbi:MAG: aldo/keto reductase [Christensenellales bacterium]|jgi:aryl-alcohol dehydrogenase-like predicted oxidoreductase
MQYRKLGSSDLEVSAIGLGAWGLGDDHWGEVDEENSIAIIRAAIDSGINFIDTAQPYGSGKSEQLIGKAIKGYDRSKIIIGDKCGSKRIPGGYRRDWRPPVIRGMLEQSLKDLQTDYIDLYQMHWPNDESPLKDAFIEMNRMREEGLVRHIGVSNFSVEQIAEAQLYCPIVSLQPQYSILHRAIEKELAPYCVKNDIGIISYGSIASGVLSGKYTERPIFEPSDPRGRIYAAYYSEENWPKTDAMVGALRQLADKYNCPVVHVAIGWVLAREGIAVAICGARTPQQVSVNAQAADLNLSSQDIAFIDAKYHEIYG